MNTHLSCYEQLALPITLKNADKGFAPIYTGHEPIMLLLHQSAIVIYIQNIIIILKLVIAPEGFEPSYVMMKTLCLNHLTIGPSF